MTWNPTWAFWRMVDNCYPLPCIKQFFNVWFQINRRLLILWYHSKLCRQIFYLRTKLSLTLPELKKKKKFNNLRTFCHLVVQICVGNYLVFLMEFSRQSTVGFSKFKIPSVNESRVGLSPKSSVPSTEVQVDVPSSIEIWTLKFQ
jgi:hypothetical protein